MTGITFYLLSFTALLAGGIAAYGDIRFGKISNKLIIAGLGAGLILLLASVLVGGLSADIFWQALLNAAVALALGYAFWYFDLWAAGDAKLFFVLALLLPFKFYWRSYLPVFPSLVILVNAFIPLLLFVFLQSVFLMAKNAFLFLSRPDARVKFEGGARKFGQQMRINYLSYLWVALVFGLVFLVFQLIRLEASGFINEFALGRAGLFFLTAFFGMLASRVAKNKKIILAAAAVLIVYLAVRQILYSQNILLGLAQMAKSSIPYFIGIGFLGWMFSFYEKNSPNKNLHFAFWLFFGVILTVVINGSLLMVWRG